MDTQTRESDACIDSVYFAQTHVLEPEHPYFRLVGGLDTLIKVHVLSPTGPSAPVVQATLTLDGESTTLELTGPAVLPSSFCKDPGKVVHKLDDCFTATIPGRWIKKGLKVAVKAGEAERSLDKLCIGPPIRLNMTMFDVHYFDYADVDYPDGWVAEIGVKRPVTELNVQRVKRLLFSKLVIPPCDGEAVLCSSEADYEQQTGRTFNGKQAAALIWQRALQDAGGQTRLSLFFINIANVKAGGYAENFGGCGDLKRLGVLHHELAHALDVEDLCPTMEPLYPYKGRMHGIGKVGGGYHAGPAWGYEFQNGAHCFLCPTQPADGDDAGELEWRPSPVAGGGGEPGALRAYSDWSVRKMQSYMENRIVLWDADKNAYVQFNGWIEDYLQVPGTDGVIYPVEHDVDVYSIMVAVSAVTEGVNYIYPLIGPYQSGLIDTFDPETPDDRRRARRLKNFSQGWDICLRVEQGGTTRTYMMPLAWRPDDDPLNADQFQTRALNLPARNGRVTRAEILLTPDVDANGPPQNPRVLCSRDFNADKEKQELIRAHYSRNASSQSFDRFKT